MQRPLTWDNAERRNHLHDAQMPYLLARASEVVIETQRLRKEGRALRMEAAMRASALGQTIVRSAAAVQKGEHLLEDGSPEEETDSPIDRAGAAS